MCTELEQFQHHIADWPTARQGDGDNNIHIYIFILFDSFWSVAEGIDDFAFYLMFLMFLMFLFVLWDDCEIVMAFTLGFLHLSLIVSCCCCCCCSALVLAAIADCDCVRERARVNRVLICHFNECRRISYEIIADGQTTWMEIISRRLMSDAEWNKLCMPRFIFRYCYDFARASYVPMTFWWSRKRKEKRWNILHCEIRIVRTPQWNTTQ